LEHPRFSPDGRKLAVDIDDGSRDVWTYDLTRGSLDRITLAGNSDEHEPVWTPDGQRVVFRPIATERQPTICTGSASTAQEPCSG
jgi:Tol biopolymer transport system component